MKLMFFILLAFVSCGQVNDPLHGYWKMQGFWQQDSTQKWQEASWMKGGNGYLLYDGKGHMSIHITPKDYNPNQDSLVQKELFLENPSIYTLSNYVYTGNYTIIGKDSVVHHRLSHGNPAYNYTPTKKRFELSADTLFLFSSIAGTNCKIKWTRTK